MDNIARDQDVMDYNVIGHEYGKDKIRLLFVEKLDSAVHHIREFEVFTRLELKTLNDYMYGDNSDVVATDTQRNTTYLLAKKYGVHEPEMFALLLAKHYTEHYNQIKRALVKVEEAPWHRMETPEGPHNHAFMLNPSVIRFCSIEICRLKTGKPGCPIMKAGLKGLKVLKTTQSKFENFHSDDFRALPDTQDRVLATEVTAEWSYSSPPPDTFAAWKGVRDAILRQFAGPPDRGVMSPSIQYTLYQAQLDAMKHVPQISSLEIHMPNLHYLTLDLDKFKGKAKCVKGAGTVLVPSREPSGHITAKLERRQIPRGKL